MGFNKKGAWLSGYLDALQDGDKITEEQLVFLIMSLKDVIQGIIRDNQDSEQSLTAI